MPVENEPLAQIAPRTIELQASADFQAIVLALRQRLKSISPGPM